MRISDWSSDVCSSDLFLNGGGRLTIANMEGQALDLAVTGSGTIITTGLDARQLDARVIGTGALKLAGVAAKARLTSNGPAAIDAAALAVDDLVVRTDGAGDAQDRKSTRLNSSH